MSTLPYQGRCAFASLHPAVTLGFFAGAIVLSMVLANPICQVMSVLLAAACYLTFRGREAWRFIAGLTAVLLVVTLSAPLFNTQGATVLLRWWGGRPYTLEALALGASTGLMLVAHDAVVRLLSPGHDFGQVYLPVRPRYSGAVAGAHHGAAPRAKLPPQSRRPHDGTGLHWEGPAEGASVAARVRDGGSVLLSLSADALESAVVAADSMTARGFGLSGRTHFALFRWEARDTVLVVAMGALVAGAVVALVQGGFAVTYFPTIVWPSAGVAVLMGAVCYGAFLAIPAVINCGGRALWRYSLSKS